MDSFPMTRDNWTAMIENSLLPDFVINIDDENAPEDFLLTRFKKIHNLPSTVDSAESSKVLKYHCHNYLSSSDRMCSLHRVSHRMSQQLKFQSC